MPKIVNTQDVLNKVKNKIFKYLIFTIGISWSSIFIIYFICFMFGLEYKSFFVYISEICFMTIVLSANNLRDLYESRVLKRRKKLYNQLYLFNFVNMILCIIFFVIFHSFKLTNINPLQPELRQFICVMGSYFAAAFMGLIIQIDGGIDLIIQAIRRKKNG